jgi:hypothetical protein
MNPRPDDFLYTNGIVQCVDRGCTVDFLSGSELVQFTPPGNFYQTGSGSIDPITQNIDISGGTLTLTGTALGYGEFLPCEWVQDNCIGTGDTYILTASFNYVAHFTGGPDRWNLQDAYMVTDNPVPFINQPLVPSSVAPGGPGFSLTVNGTGFVPGAVVNWNGTALATTFVNTSRLTATVPASNVASVGTRVITVSNPAPGGGDSNDVFLLVTVPTESVSFNAAELTTRSNSGNFGPRGIGLADFNHDGKPDLVVAQELVDGAHPGSASVFLGNGDGTFGSQNDYPVEFNPFGLLAADFNGDGKVDMAVANASGQSSGGGHMGTVSILLGNGDGTFGPQVSYDAGLGPSEIVAGDFDQDGRLDLAVADDNSSTVAILLGNGDGTFRQHVDYSILGPALSLRTGDFNGDGILDLAFGNASDGNPSVAVLFGKGDGSFKPAVALATPSRTTSVEVADFNADGRLDIVAADAFGTLSVFLGKGDGTFQPRVDYINGRGIPGNGDTVFAADFNGDGHLDFSVVNGGSQYFSIFFGNGDGTFGPSFDYLSPCSVDYPDQAAADITQSGRMSAVIMRNAGVCILTQSTVETTATLVSSLNPSRYGQTITLIASITPNGSGMPTGTVTFLDGTTTLTSIPLSSGTAVLSISTLTTGNHSLTASYSGDETFQPSVSPTVIQMVAKASVGVALGSGLNPAYVNQSVTFSAVVSGSPTTPTGTITFKKGTSVLATVPLTNGQASFTTAFTKAGSFSIVASYSGDQNYLPRNSKSIKQVVKKYATSTALTSSPNPSAHGQPVTFTATASSAGPLPTGKVVFKNGGTLLGSALLVNGVATKTTSKLPVGTESITATYNGDGESEKSTSTPLNQIVN